MVGDGRARPTLRVLTEDIIDGWESPAPQRAIADERWADLHPMPELPHPLIRKAADAGVTAVAADDQITCSGALRLGELRMSQWRGGLWTDPDTGQVWLCCAGLAKGGHQDSDDSETLIITPESSTTARVLN